MLNKQHSVGHENTNCDSVCSPVLPPDSENTLCSEHIISEGCVLAIFRNAFQATIRLKAIEDGERALIAQINLGFDPFAHPRVDLSEPAVEEPRQAYDTFIIATLPTADPEVLCSAASPRHCVALVVTPQGLTEVFDGSRKPAKIADFIAGHSFASITSEVPPAIRRIAAEIVDCPYGGLAGRLYYGAKTYELLAEMVDGLDLVQSRQERLLDEAQRCLSEACDILRTQQANPPTIDALASRLGTTPHRLNQAFRARFGKGVFAYLTELRLESARSLLKQTDIPLKTVATRLGYRHSDNFIHAFTRRFGVSPGQFRRQG